MPQPGFDVQPRYIAKLIGTYINLVLYGIELLGCYCYFASERMRRDLIYIRWSVVIALAVDTVGSFASAANTMIVLLKNCSRSEGEPIADHWTIVVWIVCSAMTELVVQCFMVYRYYRLSSNYVVVGIIFILMISSLTANLYLGGMFAKARFDVTNNHEVVDVAYILSLSTTVAANVAITCALLYRLLSTSTFNLHTKHLVRRLCAVAILTGGATSAVSTATLIAYAASTYGNLSASFGFSRGRIYTLTMLFTLLTRDRIYSQDQTYIGFTDHTFGLFTNQEENWQTQHFNHGVSSTDTPIPSSTNNPPAQHFTRPYAPTRKTTVKVKSEPPIQLDYPRSATR